MTGIPETMSIFLAWLGRTSLQASVLICMILLAQAVLRHRLPPRWRTCLWLLLVLRLALPWSPASSLSVYNLLPAPARDDAVLVAALQSPDRSNAPLVQAAPIEEVIESTEPIVPEAESEERESAATAGIAACQERQHGRVPRVANGSHCSPAHPIPAIPVAHRTSRRGRCCSAVWGHRSSSIARRWW